MTAQPETKAVNFMWHVDEIGVANFVTECLRIYASTGLKVVLGQPSDHPLNKASAGWKWLANAWPFGLTHRLQSESGAVIIMALCTGFMQP